MFVHTYVRMYNSMTKLHKLFCKHLLLAKLGVVIVCMCMHARRCTALCQVCVSQVVLNDRKCVWIPY
jgi:hypothetical protein